MSSVGAFVGASVGSTTFSLVVWTQQSPIYIQKPVIIHTATSLLIATHLWAWLDSGDSGHLIRPKTDRTPLPTHTLSQYTTTTLDSPLGWAGQWAQRSPDPPTDRQNSITVPTLYWYNTITTHLWAWLDNGHSGHLIRPQPDIIIQTLTMSTGRHITHLCAGLGTAISHEHYES